MQLTVRPFSAAKVVEVWERSSNQHAVDKALTILTVACPEMSRDELAALPVGRRDSYLLALREATLGHTLESYAECPNCAEGLEFAVMTDDLWRAAKTTAADAQLELAVEDFTLKVRLPTSADLAEIAAGEDVNTARRELASRCVLEASQSGVVVEPGNLNDHIVAECASLLADCDPLADVTLDLNCAACGHRWPVILDVGQFFWLEISVLAKRLLREVHALARAYGWREADILAMSAARRQFYLEMQG